QDVYLFQQLAEAASHSGDTPLFILGLLHQGFRAYTDRLDHVSRREWEKVAGRFDELLFHQPLEQVTELVVSALNVDLADVPSEMHYEAIEVMRFGVNRCWFGPVPAIQSLLRRAPGLFPLDPLVLPVLVRIMHRFGQNERSVFSFLQSPEPFGLQT